jgi:anaerobic selenocysteine-containing dehydrogenase
MIAASVTSVAFAASLTVPWVTAKDPFARPASSSVKDWTDQAAPDPRETSWQEASWEEASTIAVEELLRMEQKRSALAEREADYYRALAYDNEDWTA